MILAILQARMSSSRLPGKVLKPILGEPMLFRQIERIRRSKKIDQLVVATSVDAADDPLVEAAAAWGVPCVRGSLNDVLNRFMVAARQYPAETVIRLTGDCPLADPAIIDDVIALFQSGDYDYASNIEPPTFPDGLDVEVMRFAALERADREATLISEREHVTLFIRNRREEFRLANLEGTADRSALRWTVDEPADFAFVTKVYEALYPANPAFATDDILTLIARDPGLNEVNSGFGRNEGMKKSLEADRKLTSGNTGTP